MELNNTTIMTAKTNVTITLIDGNERALLRGGCVSALISPFSFEFTVSSVVIRVLKPYPLFSFLLTSLRRLKMKI